MVAGPQLLLWPPPPFPPRIINHMRNGGKYGEGERAPSSSAHARLGTTAVACVSQFKTCDSLGGSCVSEYCPYTTRRLPAPKGKCRRSSLATNNSIATGYAVTKAPRSVRGVIVAGTAIPSLTTRHYFGLVTRSSTLLVP